VGYNSILDSEWENRTTIEKQQEGENILTKGFLTNYYVLARKQRCLVENVGEDI